MKTPLAITSGLLYLSGAALVILGTTYKVNSWEDPAWFGGVEMISVGFLLLVVATLALVAYVYFKFNGVESARTVETTLVLEDLPETVEQAEAQLRRDEDMII
ncbi:hypothetical protein [Neolewinella antarctica]|uniref:Uncharacterized protein n=1 Tax=Neolewinella antarctica TaxID=442734 RepID=A0ABX0XFT8_9BACT|nr:hypothetical protein [Neolewinella antarctica]NJC27617.1 hypothetical protein [Neolewinella antarctica]